MFGSDPIRHACSNASINASDCDRELSRVGVNHVRIVLPWRDGGILNCRSSSLLLKLLAHLLAQPTHGTFSPADLFADFLRRITLQTQFDDRPLSAMQA